MTHEPFMLCLHTGGTTPGSINYHCQVTVAICILRVSHSYSPISPWSFRSNSAYLSAKQRHTGFIRGQQLHSSAHMPQSCQQWNKHLSRNLETSVILWLSWQLTGQKERHKQLIMADECVGVRENGLDLHWVLCLFLPKFICSNGEKEQIWFIKVTASNPARRLHINGKIDLSTRYCHRAAVKYQDIVETFETS